MNTDSWENITEPNFLKIENQLLFLKLYLACIFQQQHLQIKQVLEFGD